MLRDQSSGLPSRYAPTLALVCLLGAGGCASDPTSVALAALGIPVDGVVINEGAPNTRSTTVTLNVTTSPTNRPRTMCVTNTSTCTFEPFARTKRWLLTPGDGDKTVSVTLDDGSGNQTALQATVVLDTTVPVAGALTATPSDGLVSLSWAAASDALSGIQSYRLMMSSTIVPPSCNYGQLLYQGADTSFQHTTVRNGGTYGYRVCPIDAAGNTGVGETASARPAPEYDPPTGSVTINAGDLLARVYPVTLDLTATDASAISSVCISQTSTCTNWVAFSTTKAWTLRGPNGLVTINVWFRDVYGNTSAPQSATITLDTLAPSLPALTTTIDSDGITLTWSAATDLNGVASYTLVWTAGKAPPASCSVGNLAYMGPDLTYVDTLGPPSFRGYRLCATDEAGNRNTGVVASAFQLSNVLLNVIAVSTDPSVASPAAAFDAAESARGHTLISRELPSWAVGLSRSELLAAVHEQIAQAVDRERRSTAVWNVVNEAIDDDTLELRVGIPATLGVSGLAQVYKWAEEADPEVELGYDDSRIEGAKAEAVYRLIEDLIAQGARIDRVGILAGPGWEPATRLLRSRSGHTSLP